MKRILFVLGFVVLAASCDSKTKTENAMTVSGNVKGLKKGMLFLQHLKDSSLINIDSLQVEGDGAFTFSHEVESPEIFYLYLKKEDNNDVNDRIAFFGEPGEITINTSWNTFDLDPEVLGSKSNDTYREFTEMISNFNLHELKLVRQTQLSENQEDSISLDSVQNLINRNILARYRYVLNFGLNNGDSYVTPYVIMTEAKDANPKYLDSVYGNLSPEVASSKYGKVLKEYLRK